MSTATKFSDLGITPEATSFTGDKINIQAVMNIPIILQDFRIKPSKYKEGPCLHMQIFFKDQQRVIFISSKGLIDLIERIPRDKFPIETTIVFKDNRWQFT